MVKQPDLPNVPMTRWISYIALFDYEMHHVPAQSHAAVDGLSQQKRTPEDSEDEDAEGFLDKFIGSTHVESPLPLASFTNFLSSQSLFAFRPTCLDKFFFQDLLLTMHRTPQMPYASFCTASVVDDLSILNVVDPTPAWAAELQRITQAHYDPSEKDSRDGSLIKYSLLSITDDFSYTGLEFEHRKVCVPTLVECTLGGETFTIEVYQYPRAYMSSLKEGASQPSLTDQSALSGIPDPMLRTDNRSKYEEVSHFTDVTCATHSFGVQDKDSPEMWHEIVTYLKMDVMPSRCENAIERKSFVRKTKNFFLHDEDRLWKIELNGKIPHLVIVDVDRHSALIAKAHNDVSHP